jgi:hypothetical protein
MGDQLKQKADLDEFDPCQFDINFSDESDKSMVMSVKEANPSKEEDKSMVKQLEAIANLMKRIETNLSNKDKVLGSTVGSLYCRPPPRPSPRRRSATSCSPRASNRRTSPLRPTSPPRR